MSIPYSKNPTAVHHAVKHGMCYHPLYSIRRDMIHRCHNPKSPNWKNYGARGIKVCEEWYSNVEAFLSWAIKGWQKGLYLDRIDNNLGYFPGNCRWVTSRVSCRNTRKIKLKIADAAVILDLACLGVSHRLVAALYGISFSLVSAISLKQRWPDAELYIGDINYDG